MSIWDRSYTQAVAAEATTSVDLDVSEPLPAGTYVATVVDVTSKQWGDEPEVVSLQWRVVEGSCKNRVVFQKLKLNDPEQSRAVKAFRMLCAIDANCGGRFVSEKLDATPENLKMLFARRIMRITLKIWEYEGKTGNWVAAISPSSPTSQAAPAPAPATAPAGSSTTVDEDIPF